MPRKTVRSGRRHATVLAGTALALSPLTLAGTAFAAETDDSRALAFDQGDRPSDGSGAGNAPPKTCAEVGLGGEAYGVAHGGGQGEDPDDAGLRFTGGVGDGSVTITDVEDDFEIRGVVVKGGPAYNLYETGERGLPAQPPLEDLVAPDNSSGDPADISFFFVCGETIELVRV